MPLPFIIAGLAAIGSTVGAAAATVGGAAATIAAISIGGITIGSILAGAGVVFGGIVISAAFAVMLDEIETKGFKKGYKNASKEYEIKLRNQAQAFLEEMNGLGKSNARLRKERDEYAKTLVDLLSQLNGTIDGLCQKGESADLSTIQCRDALQQIKEKYLKAA